MSRDTQDTERFYDAVADEFESDYYGERANPYLRFDADAFEQLLAAMIVATQPTRAIEIGCGSGHWLEWLENRGIEAVGIDISARMCELAHQRGLNALQADAAALPVDSSAFDLVISPYCALDHCERFPEAFAEINRVARPDAATLLMVDNAQRSIARYWRIEHARVRSLGSDPRMGLRWRHEVDGTEVSVFTKMFSEDEIKSRMPGWELSTVGIGLLTPIASKMLGRLLPRGVSKLLLDVLSPAERYLCRRLPSRAALSVYVGTRRAEP